MSKFKVGDRVHSAGIGSYLLNDRVGTVTIINRPATYKERPVVFVKLDFDGKEYDYFEDTLTLIDKTAPKVVNEHSSAVFDWLLK